MTDVETELPVTKPNLLTPVYSEIPEDIVNEHLGREIINPAFLMGNTLDGVTDQEQIIEGGSTNGP